MSQHTPRVALVYPPYGPLAPPLGLAMLSAGVKKLGFDCRTFYWNIDFIRSYPAKTARHRVAMHRSVSYLFPLNEWVFVKQVFPDSDDNDPRIAERLSATGELYRINRSKSRYSYAVQSGLARDPVPPTVWIPKMRSLAADAVEEMAERLSSYDIVGISSTFSQNMAALALARRVKTKWPDKTVVLGGANCDDIMGETLLTQFDFIDYVFSGEVDFSFPEFVRRAAADSDPTDIPGIIYKDDHGNVTRGPFSNPLEDMNSLPLPDYDDYIADRESSDVRVLPLTLTLESSRGCWWGAKHHCVFCGLNANGMAFRQKTHERFQWEVEEIAKRYRPLHLTMTDNIISTSYYGEFVDWARKRQLGIDFFYEIKANLNRKQVDALSDAGITSLQPGIESFSSSVLALIKKGILGIQNVAFLKYAADSGVSPFYYILGGFPGEDPLEYQKMAQNVRSLIHLYPPVAGVAAAQFHRFSPMFEDARSNLRPLPGYSELYPFSEDTIAKLAYHFEAKEQRQFPYFEPLTREIARWREHWSTRGYTLTWEAVNDAVVIRDRRPGFTRRNFRLTDHAVAVFHAMDRPRTLRAIVRDLAAERSDPEAATRAEAKSHAASDWSPDTVPTSARRLLRGATQQIADRLGHEESVSFTREEFDRDPEACVRGLVEAGVIYAEGDLHLTLPVSELRRPQQADWVSFIVPGVGERLRRLARAARASLIDWRELATNRFAKQKA